MLSVLPADSIRHWNRSIGELRLTNGTYYRIISGERPASGRGPEWNRFWADELAEWRRPETYRQTILGLRAGEDPKAIVTGTPKPVQIIRELVASPDTYITTGSTYENRANLAENVFREITERYEGTSIGEQEIYGKLLSEMPGSLWTRALVERNRVSIAEAPALEDYDEIVVAIDPEGTEEGDSETGICVAGRVGPKATGHAYVISDLSDHYSPDGWARMSLDAYDLNEADYAIAEVNQGGDMVKNTLRSRDATVPVRYVHAKRGKVLRADPVVGLDEQRRVHHIGTLPQLEDQMCSFARDEQPLGTDRVDARVYAIMFLLLGSKERKKALTGSYRGY